MKKEKKEKLKRILEEKLLEFQKLSYEELRKLVDDEPYTEAQGEGEDFYQIEIEVFYDDPDKKDGDLRILGAIDDGGLSAFAPICDDFIITPKGKIL